MEVPANINEIINKLYGNKLLGSDELAKIEQWLTQNPSHQESEAWLKVNWDGSDNISTNLSFSEIRQRINENNERLRKQKWQHWTYQVQRVAAVLLIPMLILSSWLVFQHFQDSSQWLALTTKQGERSHVVLPDGSEVWINVDSRLEYPTTFNQKSRSLKLNGEAYFKVAKGKKLPFIVNAKDFEVKAIGTEFNITAYADDTKATTFLKEGIVKFTYSPESNPHRNFEMKPGEQAIVDSKIKSIKLQASPTLNLGNWRNGELQFGNEPMDVVFKKIERWYGVKVHFNPEEFAGESLTVNLQNGEPVDQLLEIINNAMGIKVRKDENEYWINKKR
jgi:ferric-dicitrate binding protein FerR (iron transport regulator)